MILVTIFTVTGPVIGQGNDQRVRAPPESLEQAGQLTVDKLEKYPADRKVFMYINFSAIHYPNCHYVEGKKKDDTRNHLHRNRSRDRTGQ